MAEGQFPWPAGEKSETPVGFRTPEQWWQQLHPALRDEWAPLLRAMTPTQRKQFHDERHTIARELPDEHDRWFVQESVARRRRLLEKWSRIVMQPKLMAGGVL